jgi:hypothetical protein
MEEVHTDIEKAIDFAFVESKFILNFYTYLHQKEFRRTDAQEFLKSHTALNLRAIIQELSEYLEGGQDPRHSYLREAYGHLSKPFARKIKTYLESFITDTEKYIYDKRLGRRAKPKTK